MRISSPAMAGIAMGVFLPLGVWALEFPKPGSPEPALLPAGADRVPRPIGDAAGVGTEVFRRPGADRPTGIAGQSRPWGSRHSTPVGFKSGSYASSDSAPPRTRPGVADCLNQPAGPWGHSDACPNAHPDAHEPERAAPEGSWWSTLRRWRP